MESRKIEGWRSRRERELSEMSEYARSLPVEVINSRSQRVFDGFKVRQVETGVWRSGAARHSAFSDREKLRSKSTNVRWSWKDDPEAYKMHKAFLDAASYTRHREKRLQRGRQYVRDHWEQHLAAGRAWAKANPDKVRAIRQRHIERIGVEEFKVRKLAIARRYRERHLEIVLERERLYRQENRDAINRRKRESRVERPSTDFQKLQAVIYQQLLRLAGLRPTKSSNASMSALADMQSVGRGTRPTKSSQPERTSALPESVGDRLPAFSRLSRSRNVSALAP